MPDCYYTDSVKARLVQNSQYDPTFRSDRSKWFVHLFSKVDKVWRFDLKIGFPNKKRAEKFLEVCKFNKKGD